MVLLPVQEVASQRTRPITTSSGCRTGIVADFEATWGYTLHPEFQSKNTERQTFAIQFYQEMPWYDIMATLVQEMNKAAERLAE